MKKDLKIFIAISFIIPYIMGFAIYYCKLHDISTNIYPIFQMFMPFIGVMALLYYEDKNILKISAIRIYLVTSLILFALSIINIFNPEFSKFSEFVILFSAIPMIIAISFMNKEVKKKLSLNNPNKKMTLLMCLIFILIYFLKLFFGCILEGEIVMERTIYRTKNKNRIRINFYAPFWEILKAIGITIGILSGVVLFYMLYMFMWAIMGC